MPDSVRIGILGDFTPEFRSHHATNDALQHAATKLNFTVESSGCPPHRWQNRMGTKFSKSLTASGPRPAVPTKVWTACSKASSLPAHRDWTFLGTCGGFQYTVIECARNVLGLKDADTAENNSGSKNIIIYPVACAVPDHKGDAPKLSRSSPEIRIRPGSYLQTFLWQGSGDRHGRVLLQLRAESRLRVVLAMEAGFPGGRARPCTARVRAIESPTHRFFIATLFQPQLSSKPDRSRTPWC